MVARLIRIVPLIVVLAIVASVIYIVAMFRYSSAHAKAILIRLFIILSVALCALFGLASLYALFEANQDVLDLFVSFLAVSVVCLGITLYARWRFLKHNPSYRKKAEHTDGFSWFRFKK